MPRSPAGPVPGIRLERPHWREGRLVAGLDEVGRGAWAGPVTCAAVVLPPERRLRGLRDSKQLGPEQRARLARRIEAVALTIGIGRADNDEIDRLGMALALRLAAQRAVAALEPAPAVVLVDGSVDLLEGDGPTCRTVVRGDAVCASIAAASVVAKVHRDAELRALAEVHPGYDLEANKGYPTPAHRAAIERLGPCGLHRRSWAPFRPWRQPSLDLPVDAAGR